MANTFQSRLYYRFSIDASYQSHVNQTYDAFLALSRTLHPRSHPVRHLTDDDLVSQLQEIYYLLKRGIVGVSEETLRDGVPALFLEVKSRGGLLKV